MSATIIFRTVLSTIRLSGLTVYEARRGRLDPGRADEIIRRWAHVLLEHAKIEVKVSGTSNLNPGEAYVVMSNHQSLYDIPVLLDSLPLTLRMVAKAELFRVPLWAHAMQASGFVPVHRGNHLRARQDLKQAQRAIQRGFSIWIAPEGTRSPDGNLLPFKMGGFHLASAVNARILPVTVRGSRLVLPSKSLRISRGRKISVHVGVPIDPRGFGRHRRQQLVDAVRDAIAAPLSAPDP